MNRSDLATQLTEKFGRFNFKDSELTVNVLLDALSDALSKEHRIEIRGFGSFCVKRHPPRLARNPRSGEQVLLAERKAVHFKPGKSLREGVDSLGTNVLLEAPEVILDHELKVPQS